MRTATVTILGLVAAAAALPAKGTDMAVHKRDDVSFGQFAVPLQRAAIQRGIEQIEAFLDKYDGVDSSVSNPGASTEFRPGKRSEDVFALLDQWTVLTTERYSKHHAPPPPVYMVACQLAQLLLDAGIDIDITILDAWSQFGVANKLRRRQDGIFTLPGSCNIDDIIGLETILATIMLIYGDDPPAHIKSLRNAVTAALLFCGAADAVGGGIIPDIPTEGGGIIPDRPSEGGPMVPDRPSPGGEMEPDQPENGSPVVPDKPTEGGKMKPDVPAEGGEMEPDLPSPGGPLKPSDKLRRALSPMATKRQHPSLDVAALRDALAELEDAYGRFGSKEIPMPVFIIMQTIVALLQSYGAEVDGWPDLVGDSVSLAPPAAGGLVPDVP